MGWSEGLKGCNSSSEDKITESQHPAVLVDSGGHIAARGLNLNDYIFEEVWLTTDQGADPPYPLYIVHAAHCLSLVQWFCDHLFDYASTLMTVMLRSGVNPDGATLREVFKKSAGLPDLNRDFKMFIVDGRHRLQAILTLQHNDGSQRTIEVILVWHQRRRDGRRMTTTKVMKLGKVANTTTTILRPILNSPTCENPAWLCRCLWSQVKCQILGRLYQSHC